MSEELNSGSISDGIVSMAGEGGDVETLNIVELKRVHRIMKLPPPIHPVTKKDQGALAHISTDKPIYKPNDVIFIEVHIINPMTKAPAKYFQNYWD